MYTAEIVAVPVIKYRTGPKKTAGKLLVEKRDPFERVEFAPDNSRIGRQSMGLQTLLPSFIGPLTEAQDRFLEFGLLPQTPFISLSLLPESSYEHIPWVGCDRYPPAFLGTVNDYATEASKEASMRKNSTFNQREENEQWKAQRIPKNGQRPQVLRSK